MDARSKNFFLSCRNAIKAAGVVGAVYRDGRAPVKVPPRKEDEDWYDRGEAKFVTHCSRLEPHLSTLLYTDNQGRNRFEDVELVCCYLSRFIQDCCFGSESIAEDDALRQKIALGLLNSAIDVIFPAARVAITNVKPALDVSESGDFFRVLRIAGAAYKRNTWTIFRDYFGPSSE